MMYKDIKIRETRIAVLLQPNCNLLDFGGIIQAFTEAKESGVGFSYTICSEKSKVNSIADLTLTGCSHYQFVELKKNDYIFIMSSHHSYILSNSYSPSGKLKEWIRYHAAIGVNIVAVCNGAFLLGKAGLLNGIRCTTHWKRTKELKKMFPAAIVLENILFTVDKNIITSAGSASGIDLALYILSQIADDYYCYKVARELVVFGRRQGNNSQYSTFIQYRNHFHNGIHRVQDFILNNIHQKHSISFLADLANMSERNFCRIFKKETALTVVEYINHMRYITITELLKNPDLNKSQIAQKVGLESDRQVNRILKINWQDMSHK